MSKTIYITDGDALNIDRVVVSTGDLKGCKVFYSCDLIDEYEVRLQAEKLAMLTEIQLEIEELDSRAGYDGNGMPTFSTDYIRKKKINELIQQKINALKGEQDAKIH